VVMIKVRIERPGESVFFVEDGVTVQYADDVLEVLDEDDAVIAVFRGWIYALPITDEEYLVETGQTEVAEELEDEDDEVDFIVPEPLLPVQANSHSGTYGLLDDGDAEPTP
jgi:hypothetical protein